MAEALTINGVSLSTWAYLAPGVSGLFTTPARRGSNVTVPGRHGAIRVQKRFEPNDVVLPLWINGAQPDGSIPGGSTAAEQWYLRRDELLRELYAESLLLEFTRPDGSARSAYAEVSDVLEFDRARMVPTAQVNIGLTVVDAFWSDSLAVFETITGASGVTQTLDAFAPATAPMSDLTLTFGPCNNPQVSVGDVFVKYDGVISAGRQLVIDTGSWTVGSGTGAAWSPDPRQIEFGPGPRWLELDPSAALDAQFTHTGGGSATCTISGRRRYLAP